MLDLPKIVSRHLDKDRYTHPELLNLLDEIEEDKANEIAQQVLEDYKNDEESRSEWMRMHADWIKLYFQKDRPRNPPWQGASEESVPILVEACNQFHSRAFQAMFPNREFIRAVPVGKWDEISEQRAKRVSQHMSWQLLVRDRTYKRNKDRLLLSLPLHGSFFTKSYYDPMRKRNVTQNVRAVDLCVPYGTGPRDLSDIERKTHIVWMTENRTKQLEKDGYFSAAGSPWTRDSGREVENTQDEVEGFQQGAMQDKNLCKILEQHTVIDLDDDGVAEPYIVWVDAESEKPLRIAIRWDTDELGTETDFKRPVECFEHYCFLENPDGFYGLGYGHLLGPLNSAVNKLLRQHVDRGTLGNTLSMSGIMSKALSIKKGIVDLTLGKFITTDSSVEDLQKGIWQPKVSPPDPSLFSVIELLMARGDRLGMQTEALTGQTDKVIQPTALMSLVEQGLQVYSAVLDRVLNAWTGELQIHYRLNRKYMDPTEYFTVMDAGGTATDASAARMDYADDLQVMPLADSKNAVPEQRQLKAQVMFQTLFQHPLVMADPTMTAQYTVTRKFLEEMGIDYVDLVLPKPAEIINAIGAMATVAGDAMAASGTAGALSAGMGAGGNMGADQPAEGPGGSA